MLLLFEKGNGGRITKSVKRQMEVNNTYMKNQYNFDKTSIYLQYLYVSNLYGSAIIQILPRHVFAWDEKIDDFTPEKTDKLVKIFRHGYILEINVDYPKEKHKKHKELPLLVEKIKTEKGRKFTTNS